MCPLLFIKSPSQSSSSLPSTLVIFLSAVKNNGQKATKGKKRIYLGSQCKNRNSPTQPEAVVEGVYSRWSQYIHPRGAERDECMNDGSHAPFFPTSSFWASNSWDDALGCVIPLHLNLSASSQVHSEVCLLGDLHSIQIDNEG